MRNTKDPELDAMLDATLEDIRQLIRGACVGEINPVDAVRKVRIAEKRTVMEAVRMIQRRDSTNYLPPNFFDIDGGSGGTEH